MLYKQNRSGLNKLCHITDMCTLIWTILLLGIIQGYYELEKEIDFYYMFMHADIIWSVSACTWQFSSMQFHSLLALLPNYNQTIHPD